MTLNDFDLTEVYNRDNPISQNQLYVYILIVLLSVCFKFITIYLLIINFHLLLTKAKF